MKAKERLFLDHVMTPVGEFALVADREGRLRAAGFTEGHGRMTKELEACSAEDRGDVVSASNPSGLTKLMKSYFGGELDAIDAITVFADGTPFQRSVWAVLRQIPCGETWSYADVARRIKNPGAVRAVGLANGANPIGVVVPCHRVIGSDGTLTGYGGGIERKRWLLAHERPAHQDAQLPLVAAGQRG
jgi:methylated-DNA-[protein]-cysteine S-methyltransferase